MGFNDILLAILLSLTSILVIVLIIVCIKMLYTAKKMDIILTDVEKKLKRVNGVFSAIDYVTDALSTMSNTVVNKFSNLISKVFKKKRRIDDYEEDR